MLQVVGVIRNPAVLDRPDPPAHSLAGVATIRDHIKPSHGDDQHINLVDTLHGHQEVHQTFNNLPFYDYLLCLSNASDKHLLHLLSFLIVQQSFFVVTGSNLTRLPPSLSEELSSVSVSDQCKVLLENFSNSSSKFTRCANQYAKPIFMCRNCVHDFIDVCTYYYALEHSQSKDKPGGLRPLIGDLGIIMEILSPRILVVRHKNRGANTDHQYHCKILALLFREQAQAEDNLKHYSQGVFLFIPGMDQFPEYPLKQISFHTLLHQLRFFTKI